MLRLAVEHRMADEDRGPWAAERKRRAELPGQEWRVRESGIRF
jgi:hypothetical protein